MLDQPADRQSADRTARVRLLVGQTFRGVPEEVAVLAEEVENVSLLTGHDLLVRRHTPTLRAIADSLCPLLPGRLIGTA
jgi:hypothetical protein